MHIPQLWSEKIRAGMNGQPHQQRPDKGNFEKAFLDAVFGEYNHVWDGRASKLWGEGREDNGKVTRKIDNS